MISCRMAVFGVMGAVGVLFLAPAHSAVVQIDTDSYGSATTNWAHNLVVDKYSGLFGPLDAVLVTLQGNIDSTGFYENMSNHPAVITLSLTVSLDVQRPDLTTVVILNLTATSVQSPGSFDGSVDFGGTSGGTLLHLVADGTATALLTNPADLALFSAAFLGETISLHAVAEGQSSASGPGNLASGFLTAAQTNVKVEYIVGLDFIPLVPSPAALPAGIIGFGLLLLTRWRSNSAVGGEKSPEWPETTQFNNDRVISAR